MYVRVRLSKVRSLIQCIGESDARVCTLGLNTLAQGLHILTQGYGRSFGASGKVFLGYVWVRLGKVVDSMLREERCWGRYVIVRLCEIAH